MISGKHGSALWKFRKRTCPVRINENVSPRERNGNLSPHICRFIKIYTGHILVQSLNMVQNVTYDCKESYLQITKMITRLLHQNPNKNCTK